MKPIITVNQYPIGWEWLDRVPLEDFNWLIEIFSTMTDNTDTYDFVGYTDSETLPGHTKEYTEGFTEEMVIPYRTEELNPYLRYPNQEINNNHLHSEHIRLQIREMLQIPLSDITIIDIMKKKDLIYIPHQDTWTEHFPNPGSNKNDYTLYLSDPQAQYNKLLRTQQKLRNKKK